MSLKLSVCIPTYNRVASLKPLLEQLCAMVVQGEHADCVEICVSDNGSDDGTWPLLEDLATQTAFLSIRRSEENQGFGRNFWAAAQMAKGDHLYFTGDDDAFTEDALNLLLSHGERNVDLVLFNSHPTEHLHGHSFVQGEVVALPSLETYLNRVGVFHGSFIGNLMFRREAFLRHCNIGDALFLSAYPHLFPVFRILQERGGIFVNSSITTPNDSVRGWRKMQPVYTAVDIAHIVRLEILPYIDKTTGRRLLLLLVRSLPRAYKRLMKKEIAPDSTNPHQSLSILNLLRIYF